MPEIRLLIALAPRQPGPFLESRRGSFLESAEASAQSRRSILVADDEQGLCDLFHFTLDPLGYEVTTAADGGEALAIFEAQPDAFGLVILDVHMPRLSGPQVLARIKAMRPKQVVLIVSSSSDANHAFESQAKELGAFDCLYKPVDLDELIAAIVRALAVGSSLSGEGELS